jgi:hypothetical protein
MTHHGQDRRAAFWSYRSRRPEPHHAGGGIGAEACRKSPSSALGLAARCWGGHGEYAGGRTQINGLARPGVPYLSADGEAGRGHVEQRGLADGTRSASAGAGRSQKAILRPRVGERAYAGQGWRPAHSYASGLLGQIGARAVRLVRLNAVIRPSPQANFLRAAAPAGAHSFRRTRLHHAFIP